MPEEGYHFSEAEAFYFHLVTGCVGARYGESAEAEQRGGARMGHVTALQNCTKDSLITPQLFGCWMDA